MKDHESIRQAIAAYALDAMDEAERTSIEDELLAHLPGCDECSAMLRDFREIAGDLALAAPPRRVPADGEARLLAAIRAEAQPPQRRRPWLARLAVAAVVAALVGSATLNGILASRANRHEQRAARLAQAVEVLADPSARTVPLEGREGAMVFAYGPGDDALLVGTGLPSPPEGHVFELWLLRDGRPEPVRTFVPRDGRVLLRVPIDVTGAGGLAVTIERGFVRAPTTEPVYAGTIGA